MSTIRKFEIPKIEPHERTPLVDQLTEIIGQQREDIEKLIEEIKHLKKQRGRPKLRPNSLDDYPPFLGPGKLE